MRSLKKLAVAVVVAFTIGGVVSLSASMSCGGTCGGCVIHFNNCDSCSAPSGCDMVGYNCADTGWECTTAN
jgi:hypothetical protein